MPKPTYNVIDLSAARSAALNLSSAKFQLSKENSNLASIFSEMQANGWKGNTSTTFYSNYETYSGDLQKLLSQLEEVGVALNGMISSAQASIDAQQAGAQAGVQVQ